ncbi:4'-phosphopantetheinyl transferase family protein [Shewanella baltica]|uniref:4'-phosphopantetheinyl transferase family protein n=1 Tax=Shewanella baltica TaxID=62322 RepID=UPI00325E82F3
MNKHNCFNGFLQRTTFDFFDLPKNIIISSCNYKISHYSNHFYNDKKIIIPNEIKQSNYSRQAEFLAGRYMAKSVLNKMGFKDVNVPIGRNREPVWPKHVVGSITHTNNSAICLAASCEHYSLIGIDVEELFDEKIMYEVHDIILSDYEKKNIQQGGLSPNLYATIIFSAKESLFKAIYPKVGIFFDFIAAEVTNVCLKSKTFKITILDNLNQEFNSGVEITGYFTLFDSNVFTIVYQ